MCLPPFAHYFVCEIHSQTQMLLGVVTAHSHCCVVFHCEHIPSFICPSTSEGDFSGFQFRAITNGAVMNTFLSFDNAVCASRLGAHQGAELLGQRVCTGSKPLIFLELYFGTWLKFHAPERVCLFSLRLIGVLPTRDHFKFCADPAGGLNAERSLQEGPFVVTNLGEISLSPRPRARLKTGTFPHRVLLCGGYFSLTEGLGLEAPALRGVLLC